jgi:alkylation response protein AidB-like acyl-CoA dehydrogenase
MDFEFSADQELLRATVRRFLAERAPMAYVRSMLDDERGTDAATWRGLADLGATGILVPEHHGGAGMGMVDMGVVLEELGRAVHPGPFASSAVGAVSLVLAVAEADEVLVGLADASVVGTVALLEPGRRADWRTPATTAGDDGALTGTKAFVPDAVAADLLLVSATDPNGATGVYAVDRTSAGVDVTPIATVDGTRRVASVQLDGAPARRLGAGDASDAIAATVDRMVIAHVVDGVGAAGRALELAVEYARERVQFDRPIGSFQAIQHLCADMLRDLELGRAGAYYALWAADAAPAAERHRAATMAKAFAGDAFARIGGSAIQVFGGVGFTWEHDIHLFYKRLLTLQHALGSGPDHLEELAAIILS